MTILISLPNNPCVTPIQIYLTGQVSCLTPYKVIIHIHNIQCVCVKPIDNVHI